MEQAYSNCHALKNDNDNHPIPTGFSGFPSVGRAKDRRTKPGDRHAEERVAGRILSFEPGMFLGYGGTSDGISWDIMG
jgi:hypothetical protein